MKRSPSTRRLRFFVGGALLVAPAAGCGPEQAEEIPVRTNVGMEEEPTVNVPPEPETVEPSTNITEENTTPPTTMEGDPAVNPSSGEPIPVVEPDAPYHPAKRAP
jgi:hypothetical protein